MDNIVYDVVESGKIDVKSHSIVERTIITFKSEQEALKYIEKYCYGGNFKVRARNLTKVFENVEDYEKFDPNAQLNAKKIEMQRLKNEGIELPGEYAIAEKIAKNRFSGGKDYIFHDIFAIEEAEEIIEQVNLEELEKDGKVLIKYPRTNNYALISQEQFAILREALKERLAKIEKTEQDFNEFGD